MSLPALRGLEAVGAYQLLDDLGAAPWGTLYNALDTRSDRPVLLKVVPASLCGGEVDGDSWESARAATEALGRLYHRHLPALAEVAEDGEGGLLVACGPAGRTLRELLADAPRRYGGGPRRLPARFDAALVADWGERLAEALAEAHAQGLVHGHIWEDEVIVTDAGEPVLAGFGLTRMSFEPAAAGLRAPAAPATRPRQDVAALAALLLRLARAARLAAGDPVVRVLERAAAPGAAPSAERAPVRAADLAEALRQARRAGGAAAEQEGRPADLPAATEARARGDRRQALLLLAAVLFLVLVALGAGWLLARHDLPAPPAPQTGADSAGAVFPDPPGSPSDLPR